MVQAGLIQMKSNLIDLTVALHRKTAKAARVSDTGEDSRGVWLPLSLIEIEDTGKKTKAVDGNGWIAEVPLVTVTLPERLAVEKGLV
jgi:hypothetical protein